MGITIAVTDREFHKAELVFSRAINEGFECVAVAPSEQDLAVAVRQQNLRYVIVGVEPYGKRLCEALGPGGVMARFGVGHDAVDKLLATTNGVLCTNTPGVLDDSVAEHTLNLLLALARQTPALASATRAGDWPASVGVELQGKRLAVLGCGGIGRRVARIASRGFGMEVIGLKRSGSDTAQLISEYGFARVVTNFNEAVPGADFVSLHLPSVPETHHFMNQERLGQLPTGSFFINTGRGALVDEAALFDALAAGRLAGAALDVFETEPYQPRTPAKDLRTLANVVMTPHIGSSTREANDRIAERALQNIRLAVAGDFSEIDLLNPEVLTKLPHKKSRL